MKLILIFLLFLLFGITVIFGYAYWKHQQISLLTPSSPLTTKFSLANAPESSLQGTIATMSGTVNWLSRVAKKPVQLKSPRKIQQGEELSTGKNGNAVIIIQNAQEIILSPDSDVNFIQTLPINLVLEQNSGSVTYQNVGQTAMTVNTLDLITVVNRAAVVITVDKTANTVTVFVHKGSVTEGYEDSNDNSNVVTVNAGQQFIFDDTAQTGTFE